MFCYICPVFKGKPSILFTLRSNRLSRHKGYPCFPGGVFEDGDVDSIHTALRETHEELGLESKYVKVCKGTKAPLQQIKDCLCM